MKYLLTYKLFEELDDKYFDLESFRDWDDLSEDDKKSILLPQSRPIESTPDSATKAINNLCRSAENYKDKSQSGFKWVRPTLSSKEGEVKLPIRGDKSIDGLRDKLRWSSYLNNITNFASDVRGFYYEGFVAGLYKGQRTGKGSRADVSVGLNKISVKTTTGSPTLCSGKEMSGKFLMSQSKDLSPEFSGYETLQDLINDRKLSLTRIFSDAEFKSMRESIWDSLFGDVTHFMIFHFNESNVTKVVDGKRIKQKKDATKIFMNIFTNEELGKLVIEGKVAIGSPRSKDDKFELRITSSFKKYGTKHFIDIPTISDHELNTLWNKNIRAWGGKVFGDSVTRKIRTDAIEDIYTDKENISQRMSSENLPDETKGN